MYIVFWDMTGILLAHQVPAGVTVNAKYYRYVLEDLLADSVRRSRPGVNSKSVLLQHDNAPAHSAAVTKTAISDLGWVLLPHPPYSPDSAPSDFFLFRKMKDYLRGKVFESRSALGSSFHQFTLSLTKNDYEGAIKSLPGRWQACLNANGDYFEK